MAKATFAEHPVHPMLIVLPLGLLPFSLLMDVLHLVTRRKAFADSAYYSLLGGYIGAAVAAVAGGMDYFSIPPGRPVKRVANTHAILNVLGMGLYSVNLMMRRCRERRSSLITTLLSAIGVSGLLVSGWFGGDMVYQHGMRVRDKCPIDRTPETRLPGSERVAEWMKDIQERFVPAEEEMMA